MGAANPNFERKLKFHVAKYSAKMLINMFLGRYNDHPRSKEYVRWFFTKGLNEVPKVPEGMPHVHINIDRNYRGDVLIGYKMLTKLEDILRKEGAKEYYGRVFVSDKRTLKSYERYGFKEYDRKELTAFKKEMNGESIYKVTIVKSLVS
jgi:ribosomal protein S18 acetylase RimI-like enzyme